MSTTNTTSPATRAMVAVARLEVLLAAATRNGGLWVSAAGGTANAMAVVITGHTGVGFIEAHRIMDSILGDGWYANLANAQPHRGEPDDFRWSARTVALAACRGV